MRPGVIILSLKMYHWSLSFLTILGHVSDTDICPTTEISFSDKRPCRTRIRKRTFVRKLVTIIFKIMLDPSCGGLSATLKPSLIPTTGSWMPDGTFKSAPNLFTQLFTIHGLFPDGYRLPLFYGLLPGKTTTLYKNLFEEIDFWGPYQPFSILLDYELAIHNAVAEVWALNYQTGLQLPLQAVPVEASPAVWLDWGVQDWEFTSERWFRQDGSPGFCPCWGGGESVEKLETSTSCWYGRLHLLLWVHLGWNFYHLTSLLTWHVELTWCLLDVNTPLI